MAQDERRYIAMEGVLQEINKDFIGMPEDEVTRNNEVLHAVLDLVIKKMKEQDKLFEKVFRNLFYGGSFYDGLKITHPDEYDIHMLLVLPDDIVTNLTVSNAPGFVHIKFVDNNASKPISDLVRRTAPKTKKQNNPIPIQKPNTPRAKFGEFDVLLNKKYYMDSAKVRQWMETVFHKALNKFNLNNSKKYIIPTPHGNFLATTKKTGPALTLKLEKDNINIDVDLVPCFIFGKGHWPPKPFRSNPFPDKPDFYIVPKSPKGMENANHYWLLNFQGQERELIKGMAALKPTIKLLKKMRDRLDHKVIASYYLKNVGLWVMDDKKNDPTFWKSPLSYVFMTVLKKYQDFLKQKKIPYYWNPGYNFIKNVNDDTLEKLYNRITRVINNIERMVTTDPFVIAQYLITEKEEIYLRSHYTVR